MIKAILVPTDFSKNASIAANLALYLATGLKSNVHILHVYKPFTSPFQSQLANETDERRSKLGAEKGMKDFMESIEKAKGIQITSELSKGNLADTIGRYVRDNAIDLIVMGTHGASGSRKDLLGSNTYDMVKTSTIPVLVIPEHTTSLQLDHVAFFTDYQYGDMETLKTFRKMFGSNDQRCTLVHICQQEVYGTEKENDKLANWKLKLADETGYVNLEAELVPGDENVNVVNEITEKLNANLILFTIVGNRNFFERLVHKSLAKSIVLHPSTPVLLIGGNPAP